jgi:hypothetical protein
LWMRPDSAASFFLASRASASPADAAADSPDEEGLKAMKATDTARPA